MRGRTLGWMVLLGAFALWGGWYFGLRTTPPEQTMVVPGTLMFPDLAPKLKDAARVEITHTGKQTIIEKRPDGVWGVASMHDYPVQETKLRGLLTGLTELRLMERRTTDPTLYSRLGVDDATGDQLRVLDTAGKPILALITGHRRVRNDPDAQPEIYVRRPNDKQSWMAEGSLQVNADPEQWLDRDIMNIVSDRIISVVTGDNAMTFGRVDGKFALTQPADHPKLEDYKVEGVSRALQDLTLQAVKANANADATATAAGHAVFTTNDGLAVTVTLFHADKDVWARFAAAATSDKAKAEADKLNAKLGGWTYKLGSWQEDALVPTLDALKAPEPAKPADALPDSAKK